MAAAAAAAAKEAALVFTRKKPQTNRQTEQNVWTSFPGGAVSIDRPHCDLNCRSGDGAIDWTLRRHPIRRCRSLQSQSIRPAVQPWQPWRIDISLDFGRLFFPANASACDGRSGRRGELSTWPVESAGTRPDQGQHVKHVISVVVIARTIYIQQFKNKKERDTFVSRVAPPSRHGSAHVVRRRRRRLDGGQCHGRWTMAEKRFSALKAATRTTGRPSYRSRLERRDRRAQRKPETIAKQPP